MRKRILMCIVVSIVCVTPVFGNMLKKLPTNHWVYSALRTFEQTGLLPKSVLTKIDNNDLYGWEVSQLIERFIEQVEQEEEKYCISKAEREMLYRLRDEFPSQSYVDSTKQVALENEFIRSGESARRLNEKVVLLDDVLSKKGIRPETKIRGSYKIDTFFVNKTGPRWVYIGSPIDRAIYGENQQLFVTRQSFVFDQNNHIGQAWEEWLPAEYMSKSQGGNFTFGLGSISLDTESDNPNNNPIKISGYPWARFTTRISFGIFEAYLGYRYAVEFTPFAIGYPDGGSYGYGGVHLYWNTDSRWGFRYMYGIDRSTEPFRTVEAAKATFKLPLKDISTVSLITSRLLDDPLADSRVLSAVFYKQLAPSATRRGDISSEIAYSQLDMDWKSEPSPYFGVAKRLDINIDTLKFPLFRTVPFNVMLYDISPTFLSRPGAVWNVSLPDITGGSAGDWARTYDPNRLSGLRILENNRKGINVRSKLSFSRFSRLTRDCTLQLEYASKKQKEIDATGDPLSLYDGYAILFEYNMQELLRLSKPLKIYLRTEQRNRYYDYNPKPQLIRNYESNQITINSMISNKLMTNYKYSLNKDRNLLTNQESDAISHEFTFKILIGSDLGLDLVTGHTAGRNTNPSGVYDGFWIGARTSKSF